MKSGAVIFSETARRDLLAIFACANSSRETAGRYIARLEPYCNSPVLASERGDRRDDLQPGLRIVGFERRLTIAFAVLDDRVEILRVFRRADPETRGHWLTKKWMESGSTASQINDL